VPGFSPEERIDFIQSELAAVNRGSKVQVTMKPVPQVLWIGMIGPDRSRRPSLAAGDGSDETDRPEH
jgi:hypothetical protein